MMTNRMLISLGGLKELVRGTEKEIKDGYCGDILSYALKSMKKGSIWITRNTSINTLAVGVLKEAACLIFCEDSIPDRSFLEKAESEKVEIFSTPLSELEMAYQIALICKKMKAKDF